MSNERYYQNRMLIDEDGSVRISQPPKPHLDEDMLLEKDEYLTPGFEGAEVAKRPPRLQNDTEIPPDTRYLFPTRPDEIPQLNDPIFDKAIVRSTQYHPHALSVSRIKDFLIMQNAKAGRESAEIDDVTEEAILMGNLMHRLYYHLYVPSHKRMYFKSPSTLLGFMDRTRGFESGLYQDLRYYEMHSESDFYFFHLRPEERLALARSVVHRDLELRAMLNDYRRPVKGPFDSRESDRSFRLYIPFDDGNNSYSVKLQARLDVGGLARPTKQVHAFIEDYKLHIAEDGTFADRDNKLQLGVNALAQWAYDYRNSNGGHEGDIQMFLRDMSTNKRFELQGLDIRAVQASLYYIHMAMLHLHGGTLRSHFQKQMKIMAPMAMMGEAYLDHAKDALRRVDETGQWVESPTGYEPRKVDVDAEIAKYFAWKKRQTAEEDRARAEVRKSIDQFLKKGKKD